jgi:hypothetical protein
MWRLLPKVPAALLLVVLALWLRGVSHERARREAVGVPLASSPFSLQDGVRGAWDLDWPAWAESKGSPVLFAIGLPFDTGEQRSSAEVLLRVEPSDAVTVGKARSVDAEGWFEASASTNWNSVAALSPTRARRVEYRVVRSGAADNPNVQLVIKGSNDGDELESLTFHAFVRDVLALLIAVPLLTWAVVAAVRRRGVLLQGVAGH